MFYDPEDGAVWAVPSHALPAPFAHAAIQIDLPDDAPADQIRSVGLDDFANKLVPGCSSKAVVSALQFQVRVADAGPEHANQREARRPRRPRNISHLDAAVLYAYRDHVPPV